VSAARSVIAIASGSIGSRAAPPRPDSGRGGALTCARCGDRCGSDGLCAAKPMSRARPWRSRSTKPGPHRRGSGCTRTTTARARSASLHVNSETRGHGLQDFRSRDDMITAGYPGPPWHDGYLEAYAAHAFGSSPTSASVEGRGRRDGRRGWRVGWRRRRGGFGRGSWCVGHQAVPRHPPFRQRFRRRYLHTTSYRVPEALPGQARPRGRGRQQQPAIIGADYLQRVLRPHHGGGSARPS
jgi:hypothetical protein